MLTLLFYILMLMVFGKIFFFGVRAAWGITKILFSVVFFPVILLGLVFIGLLRLAFPILLIIGVISLFKLHD